MKSRPRAVVVDTSTLRAICNTTYSDCVYSNLGMSTTYTCLEEVKRARSMTDDRQEEEVLGEVLELLRKYDNPTIHPPRDYSQNVKDQGEDSLIELITSYPNDVDVTLLFDFEASDRLNELDINHKVKYPSYAFETLYQENILSEDDVRQGVTEMANSEGWPGDVLSEVVSVDCGFK